MALRDAANRLYLLDKVTRFAAAEEYAEFTVRSGPQVQPLEIGTALNLNDVVYAVGNALGQGVVIRDGVYTSQTPEEHAGRWRWLRFSAVASPGSSGGPLVDQAGRVVGVILRRSPSENLNTAVAIAQVIQGSRETATIEARFPYRFAPLSGTETVERNETIGLPRPISEFNSAYAGAISGALERSRDAALTQQAAGLFPNGAGSEDLLNRLYVARFPRATVENADHIWAVNDPKPSGTTIEGNGYVESATYQNCTYYRLGLPDNPQGTAVQANSKLFGELLLKAAAMYRPVGGVNVRVTSFGAAMHEGTYKDPYGRTWQLRVWPVPFSDTSVVTFAMPTPEGYIVLGQQVPSVFEGVTTRQLQSLAGLSYVSLAGTLEQWRKYLAQPGLPEALHAVELHLDYRQEFRYGAKRVSVIVPGSIQSIDANSVLILKVTFMRAQSRVVWDVGGVFLADTERQDHWVDVLRRPHPPSSLPTSFAD
jgi:serine protease Do